MTDDGRVQAYFDARAVPFDRVYEPVPGIRGGLEAWVYRRVRWSLEVTLAELGDLSAKTVLDVGCGPGRYAVSAAERGAYVVGIDFSPRMLALARELALDRGVADRCRFVEADFDAYQPEERFDIVLMMGLLEFRADPDRDLARLSELAIEKAIVNIPPPLRWRTTARRVRHRLRPAPPSFYVHSPAAIGACLEEVGFGSWRTTAGWFVGYKLPESRRT